VVRDVKATLSYWLWCWARGCDFVFRMDEARFRKQRTPRQTLVPGQRFELRYDSGDYDGANYLRAGLRGRVLEYATPDIQKRQIWPTESYYVRLECDTADSIGRIFDIDRLKLI
jgi:hypothetical protein